MSNIIYPVSAGASSHSERNDCTVRALANATGMHYADAHALLSKHGRRFRRGAVFSVYHGAYVEAGLQLVGVYGSTKRARFAGRSAGLTSGEGITLGRLMPRLQRGRYVVLITGHALAVVDGRIIDAGGQRAGSHVFALFRQP